MHLLLVRHGQSYVNLKDWDQGYVDVGLTPLGQRQAASAAQWLAQNARIDALYTSTMARALETTAYVTQSVDLTAYMLEMNGFETGSATMDPDQEELDAISLARIRAQ